MSPLLAVMMVQETVALAAPAEYVPAGPAPPVVLRTWEEHDAIAANLQTPLVIRVGKSAVAGLHHTYDAADPQLAKLDAIWKQIDPTLVLVEGRPNLYFGSRSDVVKRLGEPGWAMLRAKEEKRKLLSWEPSRAVELATIRKVATAQEAAAFLFLRVYFGDRRTGPIDGQKAEALMKRRLGQYGLGETFLTLDAFDAYWRAAQFKLGDWRTLPEETLGRTSDSIFGRIGFELGELRTTNLVRCVLDLASQGERLLAICGSGHAIRAELALAKR